MSFVKRNLKVTFAYGTGPTGQGAPDRIVELTNHRIVLTAVTSGGAGMGQLNLRIYGMTPTLMASLTTIGKLPGVFPRNIVTVYAEDSKVWEGTITAAYADMMAMPEVAFVVTAAAGFIEALIPLTPSSYPNVSDVAVKMANLAKAAELDFENNGVSVMCRDSYYKGSAREQIEACAKEANINWVIDNTTLAIWPKGGHRANDGEIPIISPETGLVGYPSYTATGLICTILFNPSIKFGALVEVKSSILQAASVAQYDGKWSVLVLTHELASELPNGPWFSQLQLVRPGVLAVA